MYQNLMQKSLRPTCIFCLVNLVNLVVYHCFCYNIANTTAHFIFDLVFQFVQLRFYYCFKNGQSSASFSFFVFFKPTIQILKQINVEKMSIQHPVQGFEPTTLWLWVSFNH